MGRDGGEDGREVMLQQGLTALAASLKRDHNPYKVSRVWNGVGGGGGGGGVGSACMCGAMVCGKENCACCCAVRHTWGWC